MKNLANINHRYYCKSCYKFADIVLPHYDKPPVSSKLDCPYCDERTMKYMGGTDCRVTVNGNCGYESFERQSDRNIKELGNDRLDKMIAEDPVYSHRQKSAKECKNYWWRKNLKNPAKPLPINKIKDLKKYVETGEIN